MVNARVKWFPPIGTFRCQIRVPSTDDQVGVIRPDVEEDDRPLQPRPLELVVGHIIVEGDRPHLHDIHLDPRNAKRGDRPVDLVALHGEETNLDRGEIVIIGVFVLVADLLIGPDDLFEGEGNLLLGLKLDDVRDALLLDRRELDELDQPGLARHRDGDLAALEVVPVEKRAEGLGDEFLGVGVGLAEDLGVFHEVERFGHDAVGRVARDELKRFEGRLTDIERPYGLVLRHAIDLLIGPIQ